MLSHNPVKTLGLVIIYLSLRFCLSFPLFVDPIMVFFSLSACTVLSLHSSLSTDHFSLSTCPKDIGPEFIYLFQRNITSPLYLHHWAFVFPNLSQAIHVSIFTVWNAGNSQIMDEIKRVGKDQFSLARIHRWSISTTIRWWRSQSCTRNSIR